MNNYEILGSIGEGTYGVVLKAKHRLSGQIVAIKKFKESDEDEHVRKIALREIRILKQLKHDNIVSLLEVFRKNGKLYLVFEYVEKTLLEELEKHPGGMDHTTVKRYFYQLLKALQFIHSHHIIHRDIKPENLLISKHGVLKLCDFGFARPTTRPGSRYTDYVATRWYRSPELLVGDNDYGKVVHAVDVWAAGCLFSEILSGQPLFPGESDLDQLYQIMKTCGPLTPRFQELFLKNQIYIGVKLPTVKNSECLTKRFPNMDRNAMQMLKACLRYEPAERDDCSKLMQHSYFNGFGEWFQHEYKISIQKDHEERDAMIAAAQKRRQRRLEEKQRREQQLKQAIKAERTTQRIDEEESHHRRNLQKSKHTNSKPMLHQHSKESPPPNLQVSSKVSNPVVLTNPAPRHAGSDDDSSPVEITNDEDTDPNPASPTEMEFDPDGQQTIATPFFDEKEQAIPHSRLPIVSMQTGSHSVLTTYEQVLPTNSMTTTLSEHAAADNGIEVASFHAISESEERQHHWKEQQNSLEKAVKKEKRPPKEKKSEFVLPVLTIKAQTILPTQSNSGDILVGSEDENGSEDGDENEHPISTDNLDFGRSRGKDKNTESFMVSGTNPLYRSFLNVKDPSSTKPGVEWSNPFASANLFPKVGDRKKLKYPPNQLLSQFLGNSTIGIGQRYSTKLDDNRGLGNVPLFSTKSVNISTPGHASSSTPNNEPTSGSGMIGIKSKQKWHAYGNKAGSTMNSVTKQRF